MQELLRKIPKTDELLARPEVVRMAESASIAAVTAAVRELLSRLRAEIASGEREALPSDSELVELLEQAVKKNATYSLRRVINATGIAVHTNLGRSPMGEDVLAHVVEVARGYSTLEYNPEAGERGSRYSHIESLLKELTGAEAALAVNNNAAAVLLVLSAIAKGGEVVISRGELVEIGGSFRVPEILEQSGCLLKEVGSTNKSHPADYARAVGERTSALLKVHTSNYKIIGFTESVGIPELAKIAAERDLPVINDLGSGALVRLGFGNEPTVSECVAEGADIVTFSGDKLLGGAQAGFIVGKKKYIDIIKKHPLTRAVRIDKLTLAATEATLRLYADGRAGDMPLGKMLAASPESLCERAELIKKLVGDIPAKVSVEPSFGKVGGGALPEQDLPGFALAVVPLHMSPDKLEAEMRVGEPPVIGRIYKDRYLLDLRSILPGEEEETARCLRAALGAERV